MDLYGAIEKRRTYYSIGKTKIVPEDKVVEIIKHSVKHSPAAFGNQATRCLVLFGEQSDALWEIAKAELKKLVPAANYPDTEAKLTSFQNGYGTILFFEDYESTAALMAKFPLYKDGISVWAQHNNAMLQYVIWTSLEAEGLGASLQHYNPIIDAAVKEKWNVPDSWRLVAQIPFGNPTAKPDEKQFPPADEYVIVKK